MLVLLPFLCRSVVRKKSGGTVGCVEAPTVFCF